LTWRIVLQSD